MDRGTRIYAGVLLAVTVALVLAALYEPGQVRRLNRLLAEDAVVAAYPYPFRVVRVEGATAVMGTPRSTSVPVERMIVAVVPELKGTPVTDPAYLRAQQALADTQAAARALVVADPEIDRVRWELDGNWLARHGIRAPD